MELRDVGLRNSLESKYSLREHRILGIVFLHLQLHSRHCYWDAEACSSTCNREEREMDAGGGG
ncbi:hypothetical protein NC652_010064 [Populus alba x Populus x berolinensis]|nr:hypothetical protein NC652_010064 [Populus alba x Populus x berolinensis]